MKCSILYVKCCYSVRFSNRIYTGQESGASRLLVRADMNLAGAGLWPVPDYYFIRFSNRIHTGQESGASYWFVRTRTKAEENGTRLRPSSLNKQH